MNNEGIIVNEYIRLDPHTKTIQCRGNMSDVEFYTVLKDNYIQSNMLYEFPLELRGDTVTIRSGWQFSDYTSRKCVKPEVTEYLPQKPQPPAAPQNVLTYAPVIFDAGTSLEDIIRCVPQGVNLKSTRIYPCENGQIRLEMPGQWKNQNIKHELALHKQEMEQYEQKFSEYRSAMNLWNTNHPDLIHLR